MIWHWQTSGKTLRESFPYIIPGRRQKMTYIAWVFSTGSYALDRSVFCNKSVCTSPTSKSSCSNFNPPARRMKKTSKKKAPSKPQVNMVMTMTTWWKLSKLRLFLCLDSPRSKFGKGKLIHQQKTNSHPMRQIKGDFPPRKMSQRGELGAADHCWKNRWHKTLAKSL